MARAILRVGIVLALGGFVALGNEEKVELDKVPAPILAAVKARFEGAKLLGAGKEEEEKGKIVYEISLRHKEAHIDATLSPDGKLLVIERTIAAKALPAVCTKAIQDKYPKATYQIVEEVIKVTDGKEALDFYEALVVTPEKKRVEVQVNPNGQITNIENKDDEKDEQGQSNQKGKNENKSSNQNGGPNRNQPGPNEQGQANQNDDGRKDQKGKNK